MLGRHATGWTMAGGGGTTTGRGGATAEAARAQRSPVQVLPGSQIDTQLPLCGLLENSAEVATHFVPAAQVSVHACCCSPPAGSNVSWPPEAHEHPIP